VPRLRFDPRRSPKDALSSAVLMAALFLASFAIPLAHSSTSARQRPVNFGANVYIFTPSMPLSQIQSTVDSISTLQVSNQFGTEHFALLFEHQANSRAGIPCRRQNV
jgi:hypothetical protein